MLLLNITKINKPHAQLNQHLLFIMTILIEHFNQLVFELGCVKILLKRLKVTKLFVFQLCRQH